MGMNKKRENFNLTDECREFLHQLTLRNGLTKTAVVELAIREKYRREFGNGESNQNSVQQESE